MLKAIIFDFDGTVADTFDTIVAISNRLALEFGYKQAAPEEIEQIRNLSSREIIRQSGVSIFKLPFILRKLKNELNNEISRLNPLSGIDEALSELKRQGYRLGIITSNNRENVMLFLEKNKLQELFEFIYSGANIFGKSRVINRFLKQANLTPQEVIYVGDETRDIEAAKRSQIKMIAVSWGFNSKTVLAEHNPDFLIHHPKELIQVISTLR
ncbi:HAD-IA family hydrolase [Microseira wollei]|uniref:Phosphoglycolate phosphatase n=1 Tax=Microseira wollei NIES-4236 TaxID=2530354 RepID=A0AAV3XLC2_9CYAN|nr:HAD-IA family hydrolase [Microseira wollei]GET42426.1 phosphoglycolate phosphatase [Microseira wollei NIES-4236]